MSTSAETYLARSWRLLQGDLCRALMKHRAGHGEEAMTPRSVIYCNRGRNLPPFATPGATTTVASDPEPAPAVVGTNRKHGHHWASQPTSTPPTNTARRPAAQFRAAHEARVRAIKARIEAKWRRVASR
jgi:hypothetical protein